MLIDAFNLIVEAVRKFDELPEVFDIASLRVSLTLGEKGAIYLAEEL